jgi:hypothetical protein
MDEISRNIIILLNVDKSYIPKAEYVFRTFCNILGLQPNFLYEYTLEDVHVYYGPPVEDKRPVEILYKEEAARMFNKNNSYNDEFHFLNYRNENIPFLFSERGQLFLYTNKSLEIRRDIISSAFFFLSCWQEYTEKENGKNDKTGLEQTIQREWNFENIPIVDRYCDIFQKGLEMMLPGFQKPVKWPDNRDFAVSVSHLISNSGSSGKSKGVKAKDDQDTPKQIILQNKIRKLISPKHFSSQLKKEARYIASSEFFLPLLSPQQETLSKKNIEQHISLIRSQEKDKTIGLHSDRHEPAERIKEAFTLYAEQGFIVKGYYFLSLRNHYHRLVAELEKADIKYDISITYSDTLGYRAGTSYPYYPFNLVDNRPFTVLEIPQVINNSMLDKYPYAKRFLNNHIRYLIDDSLLFKNHLGIVWYHSLIFDRYSLNFSFYLRLLKILSKRKAWLSSPHQIYNYWINR